MIGKLVVVLSITGLIITGCNQNPPAAPVQPKPQPAPAAEPATPAPRAEPAALVAPAKPAAATAPAAPAPPPPPPAPEKPAAKEITVADTMILPAGQGQVTLPHLVHAKLFPCATCHGNGTPGKIDLTKESAHELCRDCHMAKGAGPTACGGCHKK